MNIGFSQLLHRLGRAFGNRSDMDRHTNDCHIMKDYQDRISNDKLKQVAILEKFEKSTQLNGHGSTSGSTSYSNFDPSYYEDADHANEDVDSDYDENFEYLFDYEDDNEDADHANEDVNSDYGENEEFIFDDVDETDYLALQTQLDNDRVPPGVEATFSVPGLKVIPQAFERFEIVDEFPDHHYMDEKVHKPAKKWIKRIQDEWNILANLPDAIYVKACETRMELLQAIIVGPAGTPYHDGLFIFDIVFPSSYPDTPPMVYYHSGGLRLNPNMYKTGKVCLSLLNTWSGDKDEKWRPKHSTMLQVLVSIQALILNSEPFFNEPGFSTRHVGEDGKRKSKMYNENVFLLSLKTMGYTLTKPPKHFEELIRWHFRVHAHDILTACKSYLDEGTPIGSVFMRGKVNDEIEQSGSPSAEFLGNLCKMMEGLVATFIKNGATDCEIFRLAKWQLSPIKLSTNGNI